MNRDVTGLPTREYREVQQRLFLLLIANNELADALLVWKALQELAMPEAEEAKFRETAAEIETLMASDRSFVVTGEFLDAPYWWTRLFKNRFRIVVDEGAISKVTLRCEKGYQYFDYDPALEYAIAGERGPCMLRLVGEPRTRLRLVQS